MAGDSGAPAERESSRGRRAALRARRRRRARGRLAALVVLAALVGLAAAGGARLLHPGARAVTPTAHGQPPRATAKIARATAATSNVARPAADVAPLVRVPSSVGTTWTAVAWLHGQPVAWLEHQGGVALMRFDQRHVHLTLHAGSSDGGVSGWTYGDQITPGEIHHVVAGFNGGFRLTYADTGFESGGHVAVALKPGLASIVTYTDGSTGIGAWHYGVPTARKHVYSVLQNQQLLVDRGVAAATVSTCVQACWGVTIQGLTTIARSGLGIRSDGELVWAAGEQLSPAALASALIAGGAVRAIELDINPDWVAGYLYTHHPNGPVAVPVVTGQLGIPSQLLGPDTRDFLAVVAD